MKSVLQLEERLGFLLNVVGLPVSACFHSEIRANFRKMYSEIPHSTLVSVLVVAIKEVNCSWLTVHTQALFELMHDAQHTK